jgi:hypothetical protein
MLSHVLFAVYVISLHASVLASPFLQGAAPALVRVKIKHLESNLEKIGDSAVSVTKTSGKASRTKLNI